MMVRYDPKTKFGLFSTWNLGVEGFSKGPPILNMHMFKGNRGEFTMAFFFCLMLFMYRNG